MRRPSASRVVLTLVLLVLGSCARPPAQTGQPSAPAEGPRDGVVEGESAAEHAGPEVKTSEKFGYVWTLPAEWEFRPADALGPVPASAAAEVTVAGLKGAPGPIVQVIVTDLVTVPPRRSWGSPADYDRLEEQTKQVVRESRAELSGSRRLQMSGGDAVEVRGVLGEREYSVRSFYRERRHFQFRCLAVASDGDWPCESAFTSFEVTSVAEAPADADTPRVLHLRDERFGIEFDAPDDSWRAIGPRTGGGGGQVVWIWRSPVGQIDVQAMDLSIAAGAPPDQATIASKMAEKLRAEGARVELKKSTLAGAACEHLVIDGDARHFQDAFMLNRDGMNYAILVTQASRNPALLNKVRKGFRLRAK